VKEPDKLGFIVIATMFQLVHTRRSSTWDNLEKALNPPGSDI